MVNWVVETLRGNPELAIFLALGAGYWLGALKFGSFSLGSVTGTLLAGILVGQLGIDISPQVKSVFFMLFLFAVGYGVGPASEVFLRGSYYKMESETLRVGSVAGLDLNADFAEYKAVGCRARLPLLLQGRQAVATASCCAARTTR